MFKPHAGVREHLIAARALIATPQKWCRYVDYGPNNTFCIYGAILRTSHTVHDANRVAAHLTAFYLPHGMSLADFNDAPNRTHGEIMSLFDRAIDGAQG